MTRPASAGHHELASWGSWGGGDPMHSPRDEFHTPSHTVPGVPGTKPLMFSYASPEQVKQAKQEALQHKMQESVKHIMARIGDRQDSMAPDHCHMQLPGSSARSSETNAQLSLTAKVKPEPGGQDQYTAFIRPPGMEGNGKQLKVSSKIIVQGKTQDYLRLQPDSKMRGTIQVDYGTFDPEPAAPPSGHKHGGSSRQMRKQTSSPAAVHTAAAASAAEPRLDEQLRHSMTISFVPVNIDMEDIPSKAFMTSSHVFRAARSEVERMRSSTSQPQAQAPAAPAGPWQGFMNSQDRELPVATVTEENLTVKLGGDGYRLQADAAERAGPAAARPVAKAPARQEVRQEAAQQAGQGQGQPRSPGDGQEEVGQQEGVGGELAPPTAVPQGAGGGGSGNVFARQAVGVQAAVARAAMRPDAPARSRSAALPPRAQLPGSRYPTATAPPGGAATVAPKPSRALDASLRSASGSLLLGGGGTGALHITAAERLSRTTSSAMVPTRKTMARCRSGRLFGQTNQHSSLFSTQTPSVAWLEYSSAAQQRLDLQYRVLEYRSWQVQRAAVGSGGGGGVATAPASEPAAGGPGAQELQQRRQRPESAPVSTAQRWSSLPPGARPFSAVARPNSALSTATSTCRPRSAAATAAAPAARVRPPSAGAWAGRPRAVEQAQEREEEEMLYDGWDHSTSASGTLQLTAAGLSLPVSGL